MCCCFVALDYEDFLLMNEQFELATDEAYRQILMASSLQETNQLRQFFRAKYTALVRGSPYPVDLWRQGQILRDALALKESYLKRQVPADMPL